MIMGTILLLVVAGTAAGIFLAFRDDEKRSAPATTEAATTTGETAPATTVATVDVERTMRAAGCTFDRTPAAPANHISSPSQAVRYSTFPPATGTHHPLPAIWGAYNTPIDPRQVVHNEEHGGVIVWYGSKLSAEARDRIGQFYLEDPNGLLITPLSEAAPHVSYPPHEPLRARIALTAWTVPDDVAQDEQAGVVAICPRFDAQAFRAFRDAFRGKGPERFPVEDLEPGT